MYNEQFIKLEIGDVIFTYTDGLVEVGKGGASATKVSMKEILAAETYGGDYHKRIMDAALRAAGAESFTDDLTIMTARVE